MNVGGCVIGSALRFDAGAELWPEVGVWGELVHRHGRDRLAQKTLEIVALFRC